jgi:hypothetical protein
MIGYAAQGDHMRNLITSASVRLLFRFCFILSLAISWHVQAASGGDAPSVEGVGDASNRGNPATPSPQAQTTFQGSGVNKVYMKNGVSLDCDYVWQEEWNVYCLREGQVFSLFVDDIDLSKTMKR